MVAEQYHDGLRRSRELFEKLVRVPELHLRQVGRHSLMVFAVREAVERGLSRVLEYYTRFAAERNYLRFDVRLHRLGDKHLHAALGRFFEQRYNGVAPPAELPFRRGFAGARLFRSFSVFLHRYDPLLISFKNCARYFEVGPFDFATSSGVPFAISFPPPLPPSGPRSIM